MFSESNENFSDTTEQTSFLGDEKVLEYTQRVQEGESLSKVFDGLPPVFRSGIAEKLLADPATLEETRLRLEELGYVETLPNEGNSIDNEDHEKVDDEELESGAKIKNVHELLSIEDRESLSGWTASYELAKIAENEGINLSAFSREEYAEYATNKGLAIDDDQLRASVWQRMTISPEDNIAKAREIRSSITEEQKGSFNRFSEETKEKARTEDRFIREGVRVRQGTKDSDSWLFFGVNENLSDNAPETHKGYLTFRDLSTFSSERFTTFLEVLQRAGYNGDVKVFQDLESQAVRLNDQIVMHGASVEDVELANDLAKEFFGSELAAVEKGKDEVVDGKNKSYSQVLAAEIKKRIQERNNTERA
jgi:hypothetical protein